VRPTDALISPLVMPLGMSTATQIVLATVGVSALLTLVLVAVIALG
jgi:hypothetical protein